MYDEGTIACVLGSGLQHQQMYQAQSLSPFLRRLLFLAWISRFHLGSSLPSRISVQPSPKSELFSCANVLRLVIEQLRIEHRVIFELVPSSISGLLPATNRDHHPPRRPWFSTLIDGISSPTCLVCVVNLVRVDGCPNHAIEIATTRPKLNIERKPVPNSTACHTDAENTIFHRSSSRIGGVIHHVLSLRRGRLGP